MSIMQNHQSIQSIPFILGGALLQMFTGFGDSWAGSLAAIFGFIMFLTGLGKLKTGLDAAGQGAVGLLSLAAIIGAASALFGMIPVLGFLGNIGFIVAFGLELFGLLKLRSSASIGDSGKGGAMLLVFAMGLAILTALFGFIPIVGGMVASFIALVAVVMLFMGWTRIQEGIMSVA
jgi:hypothetical protein